MKAPKPKKKRLKKFRPNKPQERGYVKLKRNDLCPCHSGKKYKKCCGQFFKD